MLIRYAGDPAQFGWLVPVPEVPELSIDPITTFGLLDNLTKPTIQLTTDDICPQSQWTCNYHAPLYCGGGGFDEGGAGYNGLADASAGSYDAAPGGGGSAVTVISEQTVGDYQAVIFRASEAGAATQWLRTTVHRQQHDVDLHGVVRPGEHGVRRGEARARRGRQGSSRCSMRYRAANPTVPLILTAVAAQPNLTVTSYIYSDSLFRPLGHPVVEIDLVRASRRTRSAASTIRR